MERMPARLLRLTIKRVNYTGAHRPWISFRDINNSARDRASKSLVFYVIVRSFSLSHELFE